MQRLHLQQKSLGIHQFVSVWMELSTIGEHKLTVGLQMLEKMKKRRIDKDRKKEFDGILIYFLVAHMERKKPKNISVPRYNQLKCLPNQRRHSTVFFSV